jgi:hypothetical protein
VGSDSGDGAGDGASGICFVVSLNGFPSVTDQFSLLRYLLVGFHQVRKALPIFR